jgi:hypothetical protein
MTGRPGRELSCANLRSAASQRRSLSFYRSYGEPCSQDWLIKGRLPPDCLGAPGPAVPEQRRFGPMFAAEIRKRRVARMRSYPQSRWHPFIRLSLKVTKGAGREARESGR